MSTKNRVFRVCPDGSVEGLYTDSFAELAGNVAVRRASRVEFCEIAGGWLVEFLIGPLRGCFLPRVFRKRQDALAAEVQELNHQIACGAL